MDLNSLRLDAYCKVYKVLQLMGLKFAKRELVMSSVKVELKIDDAMHMEALTRLDADPEVEELQRALREAPNVPLPGLGAAPSRPPLNRDAVPASSTVSVSHSTMPAPANKLKRAMDMKPQPAASPVQAELPIPPAPSSFPKPKMTAPPKKKQKGLKSVAAAATTVHYPPPSAAPPVVAAPPILDATPVAPAMITSDPQLSLAYDERSFQNWIKRATETELANMLACLDTREREIQSEISRCDQILAAPPSPRPPPPPPLPVTAPEPIANGISWSAKPAAKLAKEVAKQAAPPTVPASAIAASAPTRSPLHAAAIDNIPDDKLHTLSESGLFNLLHKVQIREESIIDELLRLPLTEAEVGILTARLQANLESIMKWEKDLQSELSLIDKQVHAAA